MLIPTRTRRRTRTARAGARPVATTRQRYLRVLAVVLAAFAGACAGGDRTTAGRVTVDTVGGVVHIVNEGPGEWRDAEAWILGEPMRIGGGLDDDEAYTFGRITGVTVGDDRRIFVADGQARDIRVFSRDGVLLFRFGRAGEGPGEFAALDGLVASADGTIIARDPRRFRLTRFDETGRYLADYRLQRPYPQYGDGSGLWLDRVGRIYDRLSLTRGIASNDSLAIIIYDDGAPQDTLLVAETPQRHVRVMVGEVAHGGLPIPFAPFATTAVSPDGRIARTTGERYAFDILDELGGVIVRVERRIDPVPVTAAERDSVLDAMRSTALELAEGGRMEDFAFPATKASITHLLSDATGNWWVGANRSASRMKSPDDFDVFSRDGVFLGTVHVGFRPIEIGRDYIAGVATDSLGIESAVVVPLIRASGEFDG